jgi:hypothetical protein
VRSRASWKRLLRRRARHPVKTGEAQYIPESPEHCMLYFVASC